MAIPFRGRQPQTPEGRDLQREIEYLRKELNAQTEVDQRVRLGMTVVFPDGLTPEERWLYCDGTEVSRSAYRDLFEAIGTTHGAGDGSSTFNLPDFTASEPVLGRWFIWSV